MTKVTWTWIDGSQDTFTAENMRHAEAMRDKLYRNNDIVSVDIEDDAADEK